MLKRRTRGGDQARKLGQEVQIWASMHPAKLAVPMFTKVSKLASLG